MAQRENEKFKNRNEQITKIALTTNFFKVFLSLKTFRDPHWLLKQYLHVILFLFIHV